MLRPELPGPRDRIVDFPEGKVGVYTRFFEFANFRLPLSQFLFDVLGYYQIHISQLSVIGAAKVSHFEINCRVQNIVPTLILFRVFYILSFNSGWMSFSKRPGKNTPQCYTKPLDSLKNWNNRFFWVDECVFPPAVEWQTNASKDGMPVSGTYSVEAVRVLDTHQMDIFSLIRAPNPTKMDEPAVATNSSGVSSAIERSPLDFADEAEASGRETAAPEMPPPEEVPITAALGAGQAAEANVSSPVEVGSPGSVYRLEWGVTNGSLLDTPEACQDLVDHAAPPGYFSELRHMHNEDFLGRIQARESEIKNLEALLETEADMKRAAEEKSAGLSQELERMRAKFSELQVSNERMSQQVSALQQQVSGEETLKAAFEDYKRQQDQIVEQRCAEMDARQDAMSIDFDEELYSHMLTAIAGRMWVIRHGLRLATMKCAESLEMRQAFADVVSAGIAKGMSEGLKHGVEHGHAQRTIESLETYDPEAEAKFAAALHSSQLAIPVYQEVRDPRNPWACTKEIKLADAIAANISRAEQKKRSRIVCRIHGVGSAHHARFDRVPVSAPIVVPQGLALILVDAATQADPDA
uniref:Transposase (Putative), gypsy type n=1 Tax=Tanacetum cinerariifolium TaxID=118510 RepID=A0A6L2MB21_TANCI|nr:transposase (putative), gypsy type [Tanacetum cinerariifolium]